MKKRNVTKRLLSILLSTAMLIGILPVIPIAISAADATNTADFISLPITIRDYAADGMLFEFNQVGATGTKGIGGGEPTKVFTGSAIGNATSSVKSGYVRYTVSGTGNYITWTLSGEARTSLRYVAIKYRTNATYSEQPTIGHRASDGDHYVNFDTNYNNGWQTAVIDLGSGTATVNYVSLFPRLASGKYIDIAYIAFFRKKADATTYNTNGGVYIPAATYNQADTSGFSLLSTGAADYINSLPSDESQTISGTDLIQNGTWGLKTDPDPIDATLNSGAKQQVYGAWIRTDLVKPRLINGKLEYTEAAVNYLADYMQQIMAVPEQNSDGSYNTYFVKGHKLDELGGTDLATKIRAQVTGGLGNYEDAKEKYDDGRLTDYTDISTWFDAAYFLLHNTFSDSTGYGKTVSEYKNLQLVKSENGSYVFNSGYDGAVYDYENGIIYNTQTTDLTIAQTNSGADTYVRGNALPAARFDPLGLSGAGKNMGYGMSGDTYGDMITASTADWADYYDTTNYNLSLEGHAQFIYYHDDELYFTFTGDDDVYLFINGVRVLDLGAAHSISKVKISLNDVAGICGLEDGQAYNFDFFYMERHGTAANFGIETNIKIVDPSMLTQKTGYQFGTEVGYNGFVDPSQAVNYCFQLTNNGEAPLKDLEFLDNDIGVSIKSTALNFNSDTTIKDLLLALYNADGSVKQYIPKGSLSEAALMQALADGIDIGERILIHGFRYNIPASEWVETDNSTYFHNTVYTVGTAHYKNSSTEVLRGLADYRVQKPSYIFAGDHFYTVGELKDGSSVELKVNSTITNNVTESEILEMVNAGVGSVKINLSSFNSIQICSASGNTNSSAIVNSRAKVSGKTIQYSTSVTGIDNFYFLVTANNDTLYGPIRVTVYNYGWSDNAFVIDYGLPVELNDTSLGITKNDAIIEVNPYVVRTDVSATDATSAYGSFDVASTGSSALFCGISLRYTMSNFMSGIDSVNATVTIAETEEVPDNRTNGVTFTEKIEVVPASVMYYEDNFEGITYVGEWTDFASNPGTEQSADQDSNYGSDPNYSNDTNWSGVAGGNASNGTISKLVLAPGTKNSEIMYFDFIGTGLELISRATKDYYSILSVEVYEWEKGNTAPSKTGIYYTAGDYNEDGNNTETYIPVITESEGGDVYEVPVIKIDNLPYSKYRVAIYAANRNASTQRDVYIDGVRIYKPLEDDLAETYYSSDEFGASFEEIRPMIVLDSKVTYIDIKDGNITWGTGTTVVEDKDDDNVDSVFQSAANGTTDYLNLGPNNEIYLDAHADSEGGNNVSMLAFYVTKISGFADADRTLQIGAHRKIDTNAVTANGSEVIENGAVYLAYGSTAEALEDGILDSNGYNLNYIELKSGTEQYITIDPSCLTFDANGKALVLVGTFGGENAGSNILALTNLKIKGYELSECGSEIANAVNGIADTPMFATAFSLRGMMTATEDVEPETPETPETPEIPGIPGFPEIPVRPVLPIKKEPKDNQPKIFSAVAYYNRVHSGSMALITVEASGNTESLIVLDEDENEVEFMVLSVSKQTDLTVFLTALFSGRWDKRPEEKAVYMIAINVEGTNNQENTYSIYAVNEHDAVSVESEQVSIHIVAAKSNGKNNKERR